MPSPIDAALASQAPKSGLRILLLGEGDAETRAAWSGITKSLLDEFRRQGHRVEPKNVDLRGSARWLAAALTFAPDRRRWGVKYRLLPLPASLRTRNAAAHIQVARRTTLDAILQIGATFEPVGRGNVPYFVYCDSNIRMAEHAQLTGQSPARHLTAEELAKVGQREGSVYQSAAGVFAIHDRLRQSFIDDFGVPASRVATVYAGPNFDVAHAPRRDIARADGHDPTALFVGAQFERKGGDILLAAFRQVRMRIPTAQLIVVGPDEPLPVEPGVRSLGYLDKDSRAGSEALVRAYAEADVFCLPTRFEPFGVAFIEAMCFELPCIGTDVGAIPELVADGETGYLVPVNDVDILAHRMEQLLQNPAAAQTMGQAGRARFERLFTWRAVVTRMMQLIEPAVWSRRTIPDPAQGLG